MYLRRSDALFTVARTVTSLCLKAYHCVELEGLEHIPTRGAALMLPKHQHYEDILLEGLALQQRGRKASWVMASYLPKPLVLLGGIPFIRLKDIKGRLRSLEKEERRRILEDTKRHNQESLDYVAWLYGRGEIVVVHPEGTTTGARGRMLPVRPDFIRHAYDVQERLGIEIPVIPVGLQYYGPRRPRSRVAVRVGRPLALSRDVGCLVEREIARLSGL
ncbi:hypothetical protein D6789_02635 [Candidatus Woesearchaeota archaeon]|nr:MAG: hypothetical protein D6789_02635 [Candidatus Woesearchaeota archaeon]